MIYFIMIIGLVLAITGIDGAFSSIQETGDHDWGYILLTVIGFLLIFIVPLYIGEP